MTKYEQYRVCEIRGHEAGPVLVMKVVLGEERWRRCKWCGTEYSWEVTKELVERNVPKRSKTG